jgi:hypothetical protein
MSLFYPVPRPCLACPALKGPPGGIIRPTKERGEQFGILAAHFQVPLVDGDDVFMEWKTGTYIPCDPPGWMTTEPCGVNSWNTQIWNERRLHWEGGKLVEKWTFASDWRLGSEQDYAG